VNSFSGTFHVVSFLLTSSSSESLPCSTSTMAPTAATGFEIDPAWKSVVAVTGVRPPRSVTPNPLAHAIW
jgi:hypothetical protein